MLPTGISVLPSPPLTAPRPGPPLLPSGWCPVTSCHTWCQPQLSQRGDRRIIPLPKSLGTSSHSQTDRERLKAQDQNSEDTTRVSG